MLRKSLKIAQILSLDVVLGAIISSMFVAKFLSVYLPFSHYSALGIAVWLIYTADHLADARKIRHRAHSARHRFHQRYFKAVSIAWFIVALLGLYNLSYLPRQLVILGLSLAALVGMYFLLIRLLPRPRFFHKEFVIAFLYASGIFLAPLYQLSERPGFLIMLFFMQYLLLALINVLLISWYEKDIDQADGHSSFVTLTGVKKSKLTISICQTLLYVSIALGIFYYPAFEKFLLFQSILLLMGITLHSISRKPNYFTESERYRYWADAVFYFPIIYLLIY